MRVPALAFIRVVYPVFVPVTFTLHGAGDETMPDGPTSWGYLLMRDSDHEPWLIQDNGDG